MNTNRLQAFSDGVIAIIITIMVLEMRVPHGGDIASLIPLIPVFISYVLSFIYIGIYWNNHHHLLHASHKVNGAVLWANLHLLFWLSLTPFVTGWMGENDFAHWPAAIYGMVLFFASIAYYILVRTLVALHGKDSTIALALGKDLKGKISTFIYALAIALSFVHSGISLILYAFVAVMWLVPDTRIEKVVKEEI